MGVEFCITGKKAIPQDQCSVSVELGNLVSGERKASKGSMCLGARWSSIWDFLEWSILGIKVVITDDFMALSH